MWLTKVEKGHFKWGGVKYSRTASNLRLEDAKLVGDLIKRDGSLSRGQEIDLDQHIKNVDGVLKYKA